MTPVLRQIRTWEPQYVFIVVLFAGFSVVLLSCAVGVFTFTAPSQFVNQPITSREVGYAAAVNWSVTYTILFPIMAYLMIGILRKVPAALHALANQGMIRDSKTLQKEPAESLVQAWIIGTRFRRILVVVLATVLPICLSLGEWFRNNLLRLLNVGPAAKPSDYDWGLAALMVSHSTLFYRLSNAFLDLAAFCCEGVLFASVLAFFLYLVDLGRILPQTIDDGSFTLVPDLASTDRRRGFEVFESLLVDMLAVVFIAYIMSYFVRIEGLYLASNNAESLGGFIQNDILTGASDFFKGKEAFGDSLKNLFTTGGASPQAVLAGFASIVLLCFSLIITVRTVCSAADVARSRAKSHLRNGHARSLCGLPIEEEKKRLDQMVIWPLGYLRLDLLIIGVVFALATLIFYKIGLYVTGLIIAGAVARLVNSLRKRFSDSSG